MNEKYFCKTIDNTGYHYSYSIDKMRQIPMLEFSFKIVSGFSSIRKFVWYTNAELQDKHAVLTCSSTRISSRRLACFLCFMHFSVFSFNSLFNDLFRSFILVCLFTSGMKVICKGNDSLYRRH